MRLLRTWPWPFAFDLKGWVRVIGDVGYLCTNFSVYRPLCSRLIHDLRERQTSDRRQTALSLNVPSRGGDNNCKTQNKQLTIQPLSNFACCSRVAATIGSAPLFCSWAPKVVAQPRRRQRTRSFPRPTCSHAHRCTRVKRQHDGEERGSVTSTVDLLTLIVMSVSRGLPLYQFWSS